MTNSSITYEQAGVNIAQADRAKHRIAELAKKTFDRNVLGGIGGFGALYAIEKRRWKAPVLVSSTDGVGTKLKLAFATGRHGSVAGDLVNHCVNDIAVQGARPLFFLDYFACGKLQDGVIEQVVGGLAEACRANGCSLIGGETAEMPGSYPDDEYDLAGFIVGIVDRSRLINGSRIRAGDVVLGLPSTGLHTNGYSLARKLLFDTAKFSVDSYVEELQTSVADALLQPHRSYMKVIVALADSGILKGAAHITGGGIPGNLPRILPKGVEARIATGIWPEPPIFRLLKQIGNVPEADMWSTFNRGIGMTLVIGARDLSKAEKILRRLKETYYQIGEIAKGRHGVVFV
ncbi:MAG: phosphoribosylformylglycinamidine cyclo-ligase [Acidobacteria bacterium]|nr:phosphoribosylformylglycinamidine cyclo-ligase [Acidobacteriota bacterium]